MGNFVTRVNDGQRLSMWIIYNVTINEVAERGYGLCDASRRLKTWRDSFPGERYILLVETYM